MKWKGTDPTFSYQLHTFPCFIAFTRSKGDENEHFFFLLRPHSISWWFPSESWRNLINLKRGAFFLSQLLILLHNFHYFLSGIHPEKVMRFCLWPNSKTSLPSSLLSPLCNERTTKSRLLEMESFGRYYEKRQMKYCSKSPASLNDSLFFLFLTFSPMSTLLSVMAGISASHQLDPTFPVELSPRYANISLLSLHSRVSVPVHRRFLSPLSQFDD